MRWDHTGRRERWSRPLSIWERREIRRVLDSSAYIIFRVAGCGMHCRKGAFHPHPYWNTRTEGIQQSRGCEVWLQWDRVLISTEAQGNTTQNKQDGLYHTVHKHPFEGRGSIQDIQGEGYRGEGVLTYQASPLTFLLQIGEWHKVQAVLYSTGIHDGGNDGF